MNDEKTWFITGAGRSMGADFAKAAAPAAGHAVVATGTTIVNPGMFRTDLLTPRRFIVGADAIGLAEQKVATLGQQIDAYDELSSSLAHEDEDAKAGVV